MIEPETTTKVPDHENEDMWRRYRALLAAVQAPDRIDDKAIWDELAEAGRALDAARDRQTHGRGARHPDRPSTGRTMGTIMGPATTELKVTTALRLHPIPTGIYHLLDPEKHPLLTVTLENLSLEPRRVSVTAYLEALSARAVRTVELERIGKGTIQLLPGLLRGPARRITQVQHATLHVVVEIFGSTLEKSPTTWSRLVESHDTQNVLLLSRNSSFNGVTDPQNGMLPGGLFRYYGAWVTPHIEPVQDILRRAAELVADQQIWGYQGSPDFVPRQVRGLYNALEKVGIRYVNSIIDFGAGPGLLTQRTRLPRESLKHRSANCIDGAVLFASLLESASLHAGLVLVPGHAFVAWEKWPGTDDWDYLETTMIGTHDFAVANARGRDLYTRWSADSRARLLKLNDLRSEGIWPME
jgi:hypothetical protein